MSKLVSVPKRTLPLPELLVQRLKDTPQNPRYHAEGSVYNHTQLVLDQYFQYAENHSLTQSEKLIFYWAAVLHDLGKIEVTRWEWGRWRASGHEEAGVSIARDILMGRPEVSATERKAILELVRWHHIPLRWGLQQRSLEDYLLLGTQVDLRMIGLFGSFDLKGRECEDKAHVLELSRQFIEKIVPEVKAVLGSYKQLQNRYQSVGIRQKDALWAAVSNREPELLAYLIKVKVEKVDEKIPHCVMTIGTPRAGKSHYIAEKYPHYNRIDTSAFDFKSPPSDVLLRLKRDLSLQLKGQACLVLDGTHLDENLRQNLAEHIRQQGARLHYLFFERSLSQMKVQNRISTNPMEESKLLAAHKQLHLPHPWEAHSIQIV